MFIGHFGLGFAGKKISSSLSLGMMFLAVQWLDLLWPFFLLTGLEKVSIDPGNTVLTPLNFESYPWSHSMLMALVWGIVIGMLYYRRSRDRRASMLLVILVFSHWILDWITHRPDLQLLPFVPQRVGLGLWNHKWAEIIIESLVLLAGAFIYMQVTKAKNRAGRWALWGLIAFLFVIHFVNMAGPPPPSANAIAWLGFSQWLIVAWGFWIDRNRYPARYPS